MNHERHDLLRAAGTFDDFDIDIDIVKRVVPGRYLAQVIGCRRQWLFGRELLAFQFRLVSPGLGFGFVLPGYCSMNDAGPRLRTLSPRSKLVSWLKALREFDPSISTARIPLNVFANYIVLVKVVLPPRDYKRQLIALAERKPKVEDILRAVEKVEMPKKEKKKDSSHLFSSHLISSHLSSSHLCKVELLDMTKEL